MIQSGESMRVVHPLFQTEGSGSSPTSPLQLHIGEISLDQAISLNALWHSRLPIAVKANMQRVSHLVCFGAEHEGMFYATAIWTDPIARLLNGLDLLELRRFAIADDAPKNTGTRVLKVMIAQIRRKWPHIKKLISYQDTTVHSGALYAASNWVAAAERVGGDWSNPSRARVASQAQGRKIRWEFAL